MHAADLFNLKGRVAIVTGGSIGLGRQISEGLAEMGADIVLCARRLDRCEEAAEELRKLGVRVLALRCDVNQPLEVKELAARTLAEFGRIDILVNNAGISWAGPPEELSLEDWNKVVNTNVTGTFLCTQAVGRVMIQQRRGKIINIASVAGLLGHPPEALDTIAYNTSKGAVVNFTRDLACKWARFNINVNAIAPGWFPTHMSRWVIEHRREILLQRIPLRRFGGEDELKGAVIFLASDASNYVTGHILAVDGGTAAS